MMTMITRIRRYLKHKRDYKHEWCTGLVEHTPSSQYVFGCVDETTRFLYGYRSEWDGDHASVTFDPKWVFDREDDFGDVAGFYHTHPPSIGVARPSQTDVDTMSAWVTCLGKLLLCYIDNGWSVTCWVFHRYGYHREESLEPRSDPLEDDRIYTKGSKLSRPESN